MSVEGHDANQSRSAFSLFTWWKVDPAEVDRQVIEYESLRLWQSARGISFLACMFSVTITVLVGGMMGLTGGEIVAEVLLWGTLGVLMLRGHQWAFVVGMVVWSLEKGFMLYEGAINGTGGSPFVQVIWWSIYMSMFMLGMRVEKARLSERVAGAAM